MGNYETKSHYPLVGDKRSDIRSPLADFECHMGWSSMRKHLVIPKDTYFSAGILCHQQKNKSCLKGDIFVNGYRYHSLKGEFEVVVRGYDKIFVGKEYPQDERTEDIYFVDANVYRSLPNNEFELIFTKNEWLDKSKVAALFENVCDQYDLTPMYGTESDFESSIKKYSFICPKSSWYYLKGKSYNVWSMLVKEGGQFTDSTDKALVCDINCGIPGLIRFEKELFKKRD